MIILCFSFQSLAGNPHLFLCVSFSSWDPEVPPVPSAQQLTPSLLYWPNQEPIREPDFSISTSPYIFPSVAFFTIFHLCWSLHSSSYVKFSFYLWVFWHDPLQNSFPFLFAKTSLSLNITLAGIQSRAQGGALCFYCFVFCFFSIWLKFL